MPKAGRPFKHWVEMLLLSLSSSNGPVAMALKDISGSALRQKTWWRQGGVGEQLLVGVGPVGVSILSGRDDGKSSS